MGFWNIFKKEEKVIICVDVKGCKKEATEIVFGWNLCAEHAEETKKRLSTKQKIIDNSIKKESKKKKQRMLKKKRK